MTPYYKAVDGEGLSFFPIVKAKRVNWVDLIGEEYALGDDDAWHAAVEKLRKGDTICCTKHMLHGYADIALAIDFGNRQAADRPDKTVRIIEFVGEPVAELKGEMLLNVTPWDEEQQERFADAVKYGFRAVSVVREVPPEEWPF